MRRSLQSRAFTLAELLVSIAIALLLVIGINLVFKTTAKAVGGGNAVLSSNRDARTFLRSMYCDLQAIDQVSSPNSQTGDPVCLIIQSSHMYAFRNLPDQQGATNQSDPSQDTQLFATGLGPWIGSGNTAPVPFVHFRSHRVDKFGFFSRALYSRQTSSDNYRFVSPSTATESWITYEHACQPNKLVINGTNTTSWYNPGAAARSSNDNNDYNFFACDWMLGRMGILLIPSPSSTDTPYLQDNGGLTPLSRTSVGSGSVPNENGGTPTIWQFRLDVAQTSIANFGSPFRTNGLASYGPPPALPAHAPVPSNGAYDAANVWVANNWWDQMIGGPNGSFPYGQRFQASPFIILPNGAASTLPKLTPLAMSQASPSLIRGCTQFIVEYAGNFYTKNNSTLNVNGTPRIPDGTASLTLNDGSLNLDGTPRLQLVPTPDSTGELDYYLDSFGNRHLRWYGFPRLVNLRIPDSNNPAPVTLATTKLDASYGKLGNDAVDGVVPLRDVLNYLTPAGAAQPWGTMKSDGVTSLYADAERFASGFPAAGGNYWTAMDPGTDRSNPYTYTAAWGPDNKQPFPKMIRIIICIDDHEGRLDHPQYFEYVFDVQP